MAKKSTITGRFNRPRQKYTIEQLTRFIEFIRAHPHLRNTEIADRLKISCSYVWKLSNENNLEYYGKEKKCRSAYREKKAQQETAMEGFFDIKDYEKNFIY